MTIARAALLILPTAVAGFALGRFANTGNSRSSDRPQAPSAEQESSRTSAVASQASTAAHGLPTAEFKDKAGLDAYVASLDELGIPENLARWLAMSAMARNDLTGSFELAKRLHMEREWATAAALTNPEAGFALLQTLHSIDFDFTGGTPKNAFFQTLGLTNPALGKQMLERLPAFTAAQLSGAFYASWAKGDPEAALNAASAMTPSLLREGALMGVFREWGARDRRAMMEWASGHDRATARLAFQSQYANIETGDPEEMLDLAKEFPDAAGSGIFYTVARRLAGRGAEGFAAIASYPPGKTRDTLIANFAGSLAQSDPKAAWELAKTLPDEDKKDFLRAASRGLMKVAPREVAEYVLASGEGRNIEYLVSSWAETDPRAAFEWSSANLHGSQLRQSLNRTLSEWAKTDPSAAASVTAGLPPGLRAKLVPEMLSSWGGADPQAALAFAKQLPPLGRAEALDNVLSSWAYKDPRAAAAALAGLPSDGMNRTYGALSRRLVEQDPDYALAWAMGISDADRRDKAARSMLSSWSEKDAASASAKIDELKPGSFRDSAIAGFIDSTEDLDPESAFAWAGSIQDKELRSDMMHSAIESWNEKDRDGARAFVNAMTPGPLKDELQKLVEK